MSAIQLISQDNEHNLKLNESALNLIQRLSGDMAVCSVVGPYRAGKSFLCSHLHQKLTNSTDFPFKIDHNQDTFTKGCWFNSNIKKIDVNGEKLNLLIFDTEVTFKQKFCRRWKNGSPFLPKYLRRQWIRDERKNV